MVLGFELVRFLGFQIQRVWYNLQDDAQVPPERPTIWKGLPVILHIGWSMVSNEKEIVETRAGRYFLVDTFRRIHP